MRGWRQGLGLLMAFVLGALGCASPNVAPRPPKRPDEIVVPPLADDRFSNPPAYPEPTNFNNDPARPGGPGGQPNVAAMGPGMGGMGGGGMGGMGMGGMGMGGMGGNGGYNAGGYGR